VRTNPTEALGTVARSRRHRGAAGRRCRGYVTGQQIVT